MTGPQLVQDAVLKSCFGVEAAPRFLTQAPAMDLSVTRIRCDAPDNGLSNPLPREETWLLTMQLLACPAHELWIDGRPQPTGPLAKGAISVYDLRCDPRVNSISPFANLHFRLPMRTLDAVAQRSGFGRIAEIPNEPGLGFDDPVIAGLGMALAPAFDHPERANPLFIDHIMQALTNHIAQRFSGGRKGSRGPIAVGKQERRRVEDLLDARAEGNVTLAELGEAAGRAGDDLPDTFAAATGELPYRWWARRRVEKALGLIRSGQYPLEDIAQRCGFADVGHLQRVIAASGRSGKIMRH